jgi:hypothetical protein
MKRIVLILFAWVMLGSGWAALAAPPADRPWLVFGQRQGDRRTIYLAERDGSGLQTVATGKDLLVSLQGKHFLYVDGQKLYEYFPATKSSRLVRQFTEAKIIIQVISDEPDQAIVAGLNEYQTNWYILEFSDGSLRKIDNPARNAGGSGGFPSPDQSAVAIVKSAFMDFRYGLTLKQNKKADWNLPANLTVLPDLRWSPDSKWLALYAKPFDSNLDGLYSLYVLDVAKRQLKLVQEKSFAVLFFNLLQAGPFTPDWSSDSKTLLYSYQPYGTSGRTGIYQYQVETGQKTALVQGDGRNEAPLWAPDDRSIAFISTRDTGEEQLYVMDNRGGAIRRISPAQGTTEWAKWYQPK